MRIAGLILVGCCLSGWGQVGCFRTVKEAAAQVGVRDGEGFRLEGVRLDRVGGGTWARVASCLHPERPKVSVKVAASGAALQETSTFAVKLEKVAHPIVLAGSVVRVVLKSATVRLEMAGVAEANGGLGDGVRVRVGLPGSEHFADGVVRGDGLVELEAGQ